MTRVEEERQAQRYDDKRRAEDLQRTKSKQVGENFQKLVAEKQVASQNAFKQQMQAKNKSQLQQKATARHQANSALLARSGIDARRLNKMLEKQGEKQVEQSRVDNIVQRDDSLSEAERKEERNETFKAEEREEQARLDSDRLAAISGDDNQGGNANNKNNSGSQDNDGSNSSEQGQQDMAIQAQAAAHAHAGHQATLPQHLLETIVNRVFSGVNAEGLSQFTIELKSDILSGARLDIVSNGGKISCKFHTDDKNVARLVKASEGALARAFGHRGLTLERLEVIQR
ncbi:MAG: hypothetical protein JW841_08585 [Deltaproteobacteria bacterium]|nr:hypothetical protein [Deltaproteobacteria bacterium]